MKLPPQKINEKFSFNSRILIGLILALSATLTAFEWTTVRTSTPIVCNFTGNYDEEEMLPPVTYQLNRVHKPVVKKITSPELKIIEDFIEVPSIMDNHADPYFDREALTSINFDVFGMNDDHLLDEPLPFVGIQIYAHYDNCKGLNGDASKRCSEEEIVKRIHQNFKTTSLLREMGGKQGALVNFTINEKGLIESIEIEQSTSKEMANAVIKAIQQLPPMNPAEQQGRAVSIQMKVPIVLRLR